MTFHPGDDVICINNSPEVEGKSGFDSVRLILHKLYKVEEVGSGSVKLHGDNLWYFARRFVHLSDYCPINTDGVATNVATNDDERLLALKLLKEALQ